MVRNTLGFNWVDQSLYFTNYESYSSFYKTHTSEGGENEDGAAGIPEKKNYAGIRLGTDLILDLQRNQLSGSNQTYNPTMMYKCIEPMLLCYATGRYYALPIEYQPWHKYNKSMDDFQKKVIYKEGWI